MKYSLSQAFKQRDYAVNDYFEIRENDQLILADPCYEEGLKDLVEYQASSTATVVANPYGVICAKLKPGTYRIEFNHEENGRMKSWTFKHQSTYYYATSMSYNIPVDSGQVGLFLKESLYQDQPLPEDAIQTLAKEMNWQEHHPWYVYMSATSLKYLNLNAFGICTGTWNGDGCYEANLFLNDDQEVVAIEMLFVDYCHRCGDVACDCEDAYCEGCGRHHEACACHD